MSPDQVFGIVIVSIAGWTLVRIFRGPLGAALARRLGGAEPGTTGPDEADIAELRSRVSELEERLDFTERVLAQDRPPGELRQGGAT